MTYELIMVGFAVVVLTLLAVAMGYAMGRNSEGKPISSQPKTFDPGPADDTDPYADALIPENPVGKRIPTIV
jgi:hypothetical protein